MGWRKVFTNAGKGLGIHYVMNMHRNASRNTYWKTMKNRAMARNILLSYTIIAFYMHCRFLKIFNPSRNDQRFYVDWRTWWIFLVVSGLHLWSIYNLMSFKRRESSDTSRHTYLALALKKDSEVNHEFIIYLFFY